MVKKTAAKTAADSSPPEPELVPQSHGGALLSGGAPGNAGGTGRPPSELREKMRGSLEERLHVAEAIADNPQSSDTDRLRALDFLAKYGLGTKQEVTGKDDAPVQAGVVILPALRTDGQ